MENENKKKIKEKDLETVAGGCGKKPEPEPENLLTEMNCHSCNFIDYWEGNFTDLQPHECPRCNKKSMYGYECKPAHEWKILH